MLLLTRESIIVMVLLESLNIPLGTAATDFSLPGIDGKTHSLETHKDAKVLVIAFICNHCPYAQAVWPRLTKLQEKYKAQSVQFIGINSNVNNPEFEEENEEKMKEYAQKFQMNFPYLADDSQETAKAYKAQCTPDIYVFDQARKLAYHGRVDDNWKEPARVTKHELDEAIAALTKGEKPVEEQHPTIGCSIKWK